MVDGKCQEPQRFLLFGQKNKISRLLIQDGEVPDVGMFVSSTLLFSLCFEFYQMSLNFRV